MRHPSYTGLLLAFLGLGVVFGLVLLTVGCRYERPLMYTEPPASSYTTGTVTLKVGETVTLLQGATVSQEFFDAAKVPPLLGRFFIPADHASPTRVVVLSNGLWLRQFGSSPRVIGQEISLDGRAATIVGIAPRGFQFPAGTMLWMPKGGG